MSDEITLLRRRGWRLVLDAPRQEVVTLYDDEHWTGGGIVDEDAYHAARLGLSPILHRVAHEAAHHLIGMYFYRNSLGSPVLWRAAHDESQPPCAADEEWLVTALTYATRYSPFADQDALADLAQRAPVIRLTDELWYILAKARRALRKESP